VEHKDLESRRKTRESKKRRCRGRQCLFYMLVKCGGKDKVKCEVVIIQSILPGVKELKEGYRYWYITA